MTHVPPITLADKTPAEVRRMARDGTWRGRDTAGLAPGFVQTSFVCMPVKYAFDFMLFCHRNPAPQPLLEVLEPGETEPLTLAPGADIRTDTPGYRVWRDGKVVEYVDDLNNHWRDDLVTFFSGGSFSFDSALLEAGVSLRNIENDEQIASYVSNIPCEVAGVFSGPMSVSMRPVPKESVDTVARITAEFPEAHGSPVWLGDPAAIGVDLKKPFAGTGLSVREGEVPVFWACGDTALVVAQIAKVDFMLSYNDAGVLVSDVPVSEAKHLHRPALPRR